MPDPLGALATPALTVTDADDANLAGATVTLTNLPDVGDEVQFVGVNPFDTVDAMERFAAEVMSALRA